MKHGITMSFLCVSLLAGTAVHGGESDDPFAKLAGYAYGEPRAILRTIEHAVAHGTGSETERRETANKLAGILASPDATLAARRFVCRLLPLVATDKQVPLLEKMLRDNKTAEPARRALAAIPGAASGAALRKGLAFLKGRDLIGAINAVGVRRDAQGAETLAKLASADDEAVAAAAIRALGKIGTVQTAGMLSTLKVRPSLKTTLHDACLRCAGALAAAGKKEEAEKVYLAVFPVAESVHTKRACLAGLAETGGPAAVGAVMRGIEANDPRLATAAMRFAARIPGTKTTAALAGKLPALPDDRQTILAGILAERGDAAAAPAVAKLLEDESETVRAAAAAALGRIGTAAHVLPLVACAAGGGGAAAAAQKALARLSADGTAEKLFDAASGGEPGVRVAAINAVTARRSPGAEKRLRELAGCPEEPVRLAATDGLKELGGPASYETLIATVADPPSKKTAAAARRAVQVIGARMDESARRTEPLVAALKKAAPAARPPLLGLLGDCGGEKALTAVRDGVKSEDEATATAAVRALAGWPDLAAATALLEIAESSSHTVRKTLALRGYIRLAGTAGGKKAMEMIDRAEKLATTTDARRALLGGLSAAPSVAAMRKALSLVEDENIGTEAALATIDIGGRILKQHGPAVAAAMDTVVETIDDAKIKKRAAAVKARAKKTRKSRSGSNAGLKPDPKRSAAARKQLAADAPDGFRVACYLDCGPDRSDGTKPSLKAVNGKPYSWGGPAETIRFATVQFAGDAVSFAAAGLDPQKAYRVGFSWWDYDHNDRAQSVWAAGGTPSRRVRIRDAAKLPARPAGKDAESRVLPLPRSVTNSGTCTIEFRREGTTNVVVSEIWLLESEKAVPASEQEQKQETALLPKPGDTDKTNVLIVTGVDYPGHKWKKTAPVLAAGIAEDPRLAVRTARQPAALREDGLDAYDTIVIHFMDWKCPDPGPAARKNLRAFVAGGGGMVMVHFACGAFQEWDAFVTLAGRVWNPKMRGHDPRGAFTVDITDEDHPITRGMASFTTTDELYTCLDGETPITILASAASKVDKKVYPIAFVLNYGRGRVFHCTLGHDVQAFEAPAVLQLFRRGAAWTAGLAPR